MKLAWKQPLIKSLFLKLLVTVKHWGRETEGVSDWWSELQASNCVHAGFILALDGPLLLLLTSTFLLSPPHQLRLLSSSHPPHIVIFFLSSSLFPSSSSSFVAASRQSHLLPSPKSLPVAVWGLTQKYIFRHTSPLSLKAVPVGTVTSHTLRFDAVPQIFEGGKEDSEVWNQAFLIL